jgi:hypothetical protein
MQVTVPQMARLHTRYRSPGDSSQPRSATMKTQTPTLSDAELDKVTGGSNYTRLMSLLTSLQQMQHDTAKSVIQNIRA